MIQAEHLQKTFRVRKRNAGFKNAAKAFFSREYEEIHALNDVSFRIEDGEAVGYIGPNGAGKSSTIKILSGILTPDSGTCVIDGRVPWKDRRAHVSQIGVVFGQRSQLWWDVPVIDSFELIRDIYAVTRRCLQAKFTGFNRPSEFIGDLKDPGAQPVARAAYAVRDRRLPAARPAHLVFG